MQRPTDQDTYSAVDAFVEGTLFAQPDEALTAALAATTAAGMPEIQVTAPQAHLLAILCRTVNARRILEFGTLGGYSTIAMARTLPPDGLLTTLEFDPDHAEVAWENIERAGLADMVDLRIGAALETLPLLASEGAGNFDFVFIDADKLNTPAYFAWSLDHTRPGGLIFADNVIRGGSIVDLEGDEASAAQRMFHEYLAEEDRVSATTIQTVGAKGYDGFVLRSSSSAYPPAVPYGPHRSIRNSWARVSGGASASTSRPAGTSAGSGTGTLPIRCPPFRSAGWRRSKTAADLTRTPRCRRRTSSTV